MRIEVTHQEMYDKGFREGYGKAMYEVDQKRQHGVWRDYSDEGYVECPFCEHATNCDDNIEELHYCFFCGAELRKSGEEE